MKNEPIFTWDEDKLMASCIITDRNQTFIGIAQCHPDDADMSSEKTGCEIAFRRAKINALRCFRDELVITLKAYNQLYYSMNQSKQFNPNSYENRMLQRKIRMTNFDLTTTKEILASEEQSLRAYIKSKDVFYTQTRKRRQMAKND